MRRFDLAMIDKLGSEALKQSAALIAFAAELTSYVTVSVHD
jgi:hypothetical protein